MRALVRREFVASSERLIADETYIPEILAALREQETVGVTLTPVPATDAGDTGDGSGPAIDATLVAPGTGKNHRRPPNAGGRKPLPEDIERRHSEYVPPADHPALRNALRYDTIGSTTIERWHVGKLDLHIEIITCPIVTPALQMRPSRLGKIAQQFVGDLPRLVQQVFVCADVGEAQHRDAALPRAQQLTRTAQSQIMLRDGEAVGALIDDFQARPRQFGERLLVQQDAQALRRAASHSAAQLMQLCQPHALGVIDHHQAGIRHIHADLDDRRGDQQLQLAGLERRHHARLFGVV